MAYHLHHIHIVTRDLQRMIDFFTECFDVKQIAMKKFGSPPIHIFVYLTAITEGEEARARLVFVDP